MSTGDVLRFAYGIKAPIEQVYRAFSNALGLEEWLCAIALTNPRPGGYIFLGWESGYFAAGEFKSLDPQHGVHFTWHGKGEPAISEVKVNFTQQEEEVLVVIEHLGLGIEDKWQETRRQIEKGWIIGIENLISTLEDGPDRRLTERPIVGIALDETPAGLRIADILAGMSAAKAGLCKDDVILEMDGQATKVFSDYRRVISHHRAGASFDLLIQRGGQKLTIPITLMARPIPEVPAQPTELADSLNSLYQATNGELLAALEGITDELASLAPAPDEWSVKEILAHLIQVERDLQLMITLNITSQKFDFPENTRARILATLAIYPDLKSLLDVFFSTEKETIALLANLQESFTARKGSYWNIGHLVSTMPSHTRTHIIQIQAALEAARTA